MMSTTKLSRLEKMNKILSKKIDQARKSQQDYLKEQRELQRQITQEKLLFVGSEIQRVGYPLAKTSLLLGLALYGKELLENDSNADSKAMMLSLMERYQKFEKEQAAKKKPQVLTDDSEPYEETMDDDV